MTRNRIDRRNDFETFFNSAKTTFIEFRDNDKRAEKFQNIYMLNVCPGSRAGGTDKRVVEIFWGSRPFDTITEGRNWMALPEYGATLLFAMDDNGHVIVSLYPAYTENRKPVETCITLHIWLDPSRLLEKSFLKNCWGHFMAYMEYTSLDGNPTILQRLRISYLRNFKHLVIDNKWTPTKFSVSISRIRDLVVAACFSGAVLIYFVNVTTKPKTTETDTQLKEVNKNLETVSKQLDKISASNTDIKTISITADSIATKTKEILKAINKKKTK
jgi:hypothetical protein